MKRETLLELRRRHEAGDAAASDELAQWMLSRARYWTYRTVTRLNMPTQSIDDVVQEVWIRLWRNVDRYDPQLSAPDTWAGLHCRGEVMDYARRQILTGYSRHSKDQAPGVFSTSDVDVRMKQGARYDENNDCARSANIASDPRSDWGWQTVDIEDTLAAMPERDATFCRGYFVNGLTMKQIAAQMGLSESRISQFWSTEGERIRAWLFREFTEGRPSTSLRGPNNGKANDAGSGQDPRAGRLERDRQATGRAA